MGEEQRIVCGHCWHIAAGVVVVGTRLRGMVRAAREEGGMFVGVESLVSLVRGAVGMTGLPYTLVRRK